MHLGRKVCRRRRGRKGVFVLTEWVEIYFYADVGNETYDTRDFVEPQPAVWRG